MGWVVKKGVQCGFVENIQDKKFYEEKEILKLNLITVRLFISWNTFKIMQFVAFENLVVVWDVYAT